MAPTNPVSVTVSMDTVDLRKAEATPVRGPDHVDTLQGLLKAAARNNSSFDPGPIDGIGGSRTKQAVGNFQSAKGLQKDFIVGVNTWRALIQHRP
jgi:peptidoglycan hydrolase-like protein with peptidoglycan-binding domain